MLYINLFLITFIVVNIIDISGVISSIKHQLSRYFNVDDTRIHLPLFECSYCLNWWLSLIYIIANHNFQLQYIAFILLMSSMTGVIADSQMIIINKIQNLINKL